MEGGHGVWWVMRGLRGASGSVDHLQQSFLRMKMAFMIRMINPPRLKVLVDMVHDIIGDGPKGSQFLGVFIRDLYAKFFFDGHKRFENVE